jgi:hypothetical protein
VRTVEPSQADPVCSHRIGVDQCSPRSWLHESSRLFDPSLARLFISRDPLGAGAVCPSLPAGTMSALRVHEAPPSSERAAVAASPRDLSRLLVWMTTRSAAPPRDAVGAVAGSTVPCGGPVATHSMVDKLAASMARTEAVTSVGSAGHEVASPSWERSVSTRRLSRQKTSSTRPPTTTGEGLPIVCCSRSVEFEWTSSSGPQLLPLSDDRFSTMST